MRKSQILFLSVVFGCSFAIHAEAIRPNSESGSEYPVPSDSVRGDSTENYFGNSQGRPGPSNQAPGTSSEEGRPLSSFEMQDGGNTENLQAVAEAPNPGSTPNADQMSRAPASVSVSQALSKPAVGSLSPQIQAEPEEVVIEVTGLQTFSVYLQLKGALEDFLKDSAELEDRLYSKNRVLFAVRSKLTKEKLKEDLTRFSFSSASERPSQSIQVVVR